MNKRILKALRARARELAPIQADYVVQVEHKKMVENSRGHQVEMVHKHDAFVDQSPRKILATLKQKWNEMPRRQRSLEAISKMKV